MKKILIVKMWALGDIVMATPMLSAIRAKEPDAHITWVIDSSHAEVLANHPMIDELVPVDSAAWRRLLRKGDLIGWIKRGFELNTQMRSRKFDAVINGQPEKSWSRWLCVAPKRIGLYPFPTLPMSRLQYSASIPKPNGLHNTDHYLQATAAIGFPPADKQLSIGRTPEEDSYLAAFDADHPRASSLPRVVIAPFTTAANKSIDPAFTAEIAGWLADEYRAQIVITGGPGDIAQAKGIVAMAPKAGAIVAEGTSLRQYIALLRSADLVVTADSSALHLSAALRTPYVALFGPTSADELAPLAGDGVVVSKKILCAPCRMPTCSNGIFQHCLKSIELADVQSAVRKLLASPTEAPVKA